MFLKNVWNNNSSKIFKVTSLLIIFFILFLDIIPSWFSIIKSFFNGSIFEQKTLTELAAQIVSVHAKLLTLGFLLTIFLIFKRKLTLTSFSIICLSPWVLGIYEIMDRTIHPLFMKMGLFSYFMRPGIPDLNPQYTRLTLFLLSTLTLFVVSYYKKTRTIDRSFMSLISGSMIMTAFIFHLAIPMGMLKYAKQDRLNTYVTNMLELPTEFFCKNKTCVFFNKNFEEKTDKFVGNRDLSLKFNGFINYSKEFFSNKENLVFPVYGNSGDFIGTSSTFHACAYKNEEFICTFDNDSMKSYGVLSQVLFSFLTSIAHGIWIFGGIFLLFMHKNRSIKKLAYPPSPKN